jgi:two-component system chemotaxis response regulator CheY
MAVRALIAEGSRAVRNAIRFHLECVGCDVVAEVGTAAQAMQLFRTVRPDVVTLGSELSGADGISPLSLVRDIRGETPDTTIVVLSASEGQTAPAEEDFLREGARDCIVGPLGSGTFEFLWRRLSAIYPELKDQGFGAIISNPFQQGRGQNRPMA